MCGIVLAFCTAFCNRLAPGCADALIEALSRRLSSGNLTSVEKPNPSCIPDILVEQNTPKEPNSSCRQDKHFINARRLITHSESPNLWKWTYFNDDPRFSGVEVAELLPVSKIYIEAKINYTDWPLVSDTKYHFYLIFKTAKGWTGLNCLMKATVKKNQPQSMYGFLVISAGRTSSRSYSTQLPEGRPDGWMELRLGMFFCEDNNKDQEVVVTFENAMYSSSDFKGLIIGGIEFRPED